MLNIVLGCINSVKHCFSMHSHCLKLFCREMLKYGTFCRKKLDSALWAKKMANLRCEPTPHFIPLWAWEGTSAKGIPWEEGGGLTARSSWKGSQGLPKKYHFRIDHFCIPPKILPPLLIAMLTKFRMFATDADFPRPLIPWHFHLLADDQRSGSQIKGCLKRHVGGENYTFLAHMCILSNKLRLPFDLFQIIHLWHCLQNKRRRILC